jgi:hypothetical protein
MPINRPKPPVHATTLSLQDQFPGPEALPNTGPTQPYRPVSSTYGMAVNFADELRKADIPIA